MMISDANPYLTALRSLWSLVGEGAGEPSDWTALVERVRLRIGTERQYRDEIAQWRAAASLGSPVPVSTPAELIQRLEAISRRLERIDVRLQWVEDHLGSTAVEGCVLDELIGGVRFQIALVPQAPRPGSEVSWLVNGYYVSREVFGTIHDSVCGSIAVRQYQREKR